MKNKIEDLRNHLFMALEALADKADPMPIERAKAIAEVGQVIVNSAKVECDFIKATGQANGTGFIDPKPQVPALPVPPGMPRLVQGRDNR